MEAIGAALMFTAIVIAIFSANIYYELVKIRQLLEKK